MDLVYLMFGNPYTLICLSSLNTCAYLHSWVCKEKSAYSCYHKLCMRQIRRHTNLKSLYTLLFFLLSSCLSLEILKCVRLPSFSASLLKGLRHANIVTLHDIIHTKETLTFVFEYVVSLSKIFQWHYYSSVDTFSQKAQLYSTDVLNIAKSCKTSSWKRSIFSIGVTYIITS